MEWNGADLIEVTKILHAPYEPYKTDRGTRRLILRLHDLGIFTYSSQLYRQDIQKRSDGTYCEVWQKPYVSFIVAKEPSKLVARLSEETDIAVFGVLLRPYKVLNDPGELVVTQFRSTGSVEALREAAWQIHETLEARDTSNDDLFSLNSFRGNKAWAIDVAVTEWQAKRDLLQLLQLIQIAASQGPNLIVIPEELRSMIFGYLSIDDLKAISEVCVFLRENVAQTVFNTLAIPLYPLYKMNLKRANMWLDRHSYRQCLKVLRFRFPYPCGKHGSVYYEDIVNILQKAREINEQVVIALESGNAIELYPQGREIGQTILTEGKQRGFGLALEHFDVDDLSQLLWPNDGILSIESLRISIHSTDPYVILRNLPSIRVNNLTIDTAPNVTVHYLFEVIKNIKDVRKISIDGCSFDESSLLAKSGNWPSLSSCTLRSWNTETVGWYPSGTSILFINVYSIDDKTSIHLIEPWPAGPDYSRCQENKIQRVGRLSTEVVISEVAWMNDQAFSSNLKGAYVFLDWCYAHCWQWVDQEVFGLPEVRICVKEASGSTQWLTLFETCNAIGERNARREIRQLLEVRLACWQKETGMLLGLKRRRRYGIGTDFAYSGVSNPTPFLTYE